MIDFLNTIPTEAYIGTDNIINTVGIKWGFITKANQLYGRETVIRLLDKIEADKEYQRLWHSWFYGDPDLQKAV